MENKKMTKEQLSAMIDEMAVKEQRLRKILREAYECADDIQLDLRDIVEARDQLANEATENEERVKQSCLGTVADAYRRRYQDIRSLIDVMDTMTR